MLWAIAALVPYAILVNAGPTTVLPPSQPGNLTSVSTTKEHHGQDFCSKVFNTLFPCIGINWLKDGLSQALDKKYATEGIIDNISEKNMNGYKRNPLGESIIYNQPTLMAALLENGADVKGQMRRRNFRDVYQVQDPIDLLFKNDKYLTQIPAFLPTLLKYYFQQYPSEFLDKAIDIISNCLRVSDQCTLIVTRFARGVNVQFPVEGAIFDWVDYAFKAKKGQTLSLIFNEIIGAPENLEPVKKLYKDIQSLPDRDAVTVQDLQAAMSKLEAEVANLIQLEKPLLNEETTS
jgi:hypothetical protein